MLLVRVLVTLIEEEALTLLTFIDACGVTHRLGRRSGHDAEIVVRPFDRQLHWKLLLNSYLFLGEAYMEGTVTVERGDVYDLLDLGARNLARLKPQRAARLGRSRTFVQQYNPVARCPPRRPRRRAAEAGLEDRARFCVRDSRGEVQLAERIDAVPLTRDYLFKRARSMTAVLERAA